MNLDKLVVSEEAALAAIIEIKLSINRRLREKGAITEEMYNRAKELILKDERRVA
ncbi:MAG: hypothetical protein FWE44_06225 [Defluviitaleaceae bacterium]|nr:hypothetical protein [Defluviitaleaceae bacterium]